MYVPTAFAEADPTRLHAFVEQNSFGLLVSQVDGRPFATHLPLLLEPTAGPHGTLVGHMARANPQWRELAGQTALAVFSGPHAYVSPTWYATEVAVPTWNYVAVHAYGRPRLLADAAAVRALLERIVREFEDPLPAGERWSMERLDSDYAAQMAGAVAAFELPISRLEGKRKLSQNRSPADRRGVVGALRRQGEPLGLDVASLMAAGLEPGD
jgi:transcriptional regulator